MKNLGAWVWLQQGARQLARSRASTAILAVSVAVSAAFFSAVLMAYLMLGSHYPAGALHAQSFISLGQAQSGKRHDAVDLNHYDALAQLPSEAGRFYAANTGSSYALQSATGKSMARTGFASDGFLPALGVELVVGRWPSRQELVLSSDTATVLYGSPAEAVGKPVKLGSMDGRISGVFSSSFEGLHPAWDNAPPTSAWATQEDIFSVAGFAGQFPEDIQRQIPLFRMFLKPGSIHSTRQAAANASQLVTASGLGDEQWDAVAGVFQGLAEHDAMTRIVAPAAVALAGLVLALLLAQIAHEARTVEARAQTVFLRTRFGASWARISSQEAMTAIPLSLLFALLALVAASSFLYAANSEAVALTRTSPYAQHLLWRAVLVPVLALPLLPIASRLILLVLLYHRPSGAPPRLALTFLGVSVGLGLLSATLLLSLSRGTLPLLDQVDSEARRTSYLAADRTRVDVSSVDAGAMAALASSLRNSGVDADTTSSAPFSKCDQPIKFRPSGAEATSSVSANLVAIGDTTLSLLGMRLKEGRVPGPGEVLVSASVSDALASSGSVGGRITLADGSERVVSGIAEDAIFDSPSSDSAMRVFSTDMAAACPSFLVIRSDRAEDLARAENAFGEAFGPAVVTNRAERAMHQLYAPVMLGRATMIASAAVLLAVIYLIAEALLGFLTASGRTFASMQSLGASLTDANIQTWKRTSWPIGSAVALSLAPLACSWYLFDIHEVLESTVVLETLTWMLAMMLTTLLLSGALWHHRRAKQNISDILRDE